VTVEFNTDDRVDDMFLKLVLAVGDILKASGCEFSILQSACIKADTPLVETNKLPPEFIDKVNATKNMDELLALLIECPYCNWINVCMLEKMAALSCQKEVKHLIAKYKKNIFSKKLTDVLEDFPDYEGTDEFYTKIRDKWNKDLEDITIEDVAKHWIKLQKIFDVKDLELLLENVLKSSVEIPVELASHARLSAFKKRYDLEDVSYLSIGDRVITVEHISTTIGILT